MKLYPFQDLKLANEPIIDELKRAAMQVLDSGWYLHGEHTKAFELQIAALCRVKHCVAVGNGLDALRLIIRAYKEMGVMSDGDEVIVPANTFVASALAVSDNNLVPRFCDVSAETMNLDIDKVEEQINERTKAIMVVHLYGNPCWSWKLVEIAQRHGLKIIEDNAQAIGAQADEPGMNRTYTTGGLGDAAGISFYPAKNLGAMGDAGAVTTNDSHLAEMVRTLANYGSPIRYRHAYCGANSRIDEIQAAMLCVKLKYLVAENNRRRSIARAYDANIKNPLVKKPKIFDSLRQVWHQYEIRVERRDEFRDFMKQNGVATDVHYPVPLHKQHCYEQFANLSLPVAETMANEVVSLPIAHPISVEDAIEIATIINRFV